MSKDLFSDKLATPIDRHDHIKGSTASTVTLVEYGDYQCKYTRAAEPVMKKLQNHYIDRLRFVFRNFPLEKHEHAQNAAEAAEAAAAQGFFWEMHDYLLTHTEELDDQSLINAAEILGLDMDKFEQDMAEHRFANRVADDVRTGRHSGVDETPTFFINETKYSGRTDFEELKSALEDAEEYG